MTRRTTHNVSILASATVLLALALSAAEAGPGPERRERNVAGEFDYYALVLSWSPTHCSSPEGADDALQCNRRDGRRYAFVLHGLWPQYERGFPGSCWTEKKPWVPRELVDRMLDIMPSPKLVIHEYKKHGTCSGLSPAAYFETSRRLFGKVQIPDRYINPYETQFVSPATLADDFTDSNPWLEPEMLAIACGGPGNRLREVRICFTRAGEPRACGDNERQSKLCAAPKMFIPPVRSSKLGPDSPEDRAAATPTSPNRPRVIESLRD